MVSLNTISIPHWFYSNRVIFFRELTAPLKFQYHTGSIQTIPLLIASIADVIFQYHTGSIQTLNHRRKHTYNNFISIPHWFYSNVQCRKSTGSRETAFQYHTGSIQTWVLQYETDNFFAFQYHTGSIQTSASRYAEKAVTIFQYHTGSIQTCNDHVICSCRRDFNTTLVLFKRRSQSNYDEQHILISIPHWFYSNDNARSCLYKL